MLRCCLLIASFTLLPAITRADIPPPPGYVEQCTVAKQARAGRTCQTCRTYHSEAPGVCGERLGTGFTYGCRTIGASVWTEVWCRASPDAGRTTGADEGLAVDADSGSPVRPGASIDAGASIVSDVARPATARADVAPDDDDGGCSALGQRGGSGASLALLLAGLMLARRNRR